MNYQIWWLLRGEGNRERHIKTLNKYVSFFRVSIHAHFVAFLMASYKLHETNKKVVGVKYLSQLLGEMPDNKEKKELIKRLDHVATKQIWKKISILRNEYFAHSKRGRSYTDVFAKAKVTPNELKEFLISFEAILNEVAVVCNLREVCLSDHTTRETERMLSDLASFSEGIEIPYQEDNWEERLFEEEA